MKKRLIYFFFLITSILHMGCTEFARHKDADLNDVANGRASIILLRLAVKLDGEAYEPFRTSVPDDNISFGVGGFDTGGKMKRIETGLHYLSPKSRKEGWAYLILPPGRHYFTLQAPRRTDIFSYLKLFSGTPRWFMTVSGARRLIYGGTIHIDSSDPHTWMKMLFTDRKLLVKIPDDVTIDASDEMQAKRLLRSHFSEYGEAETLLLETFSGGPLIINAPVPKPQ